MTEFHIKSHKVLNKKCILFTLVLMVFPVLVLAVSSPQSWGSDLVPNQQRQYGDKDCGPQSLLIICKRLGISSTLADLCRLSDMDESGTTMYGLRQAALSIGLNAIGMSIDIDQLSLLRNPAIGHTKDNHFVVIERFEKGTFCIVDSSKGTYLLTKDELSNIWDGKVLVLSRTEKTIDTPRILFDEYIYDFGEAEQQQEIVHTYRFKNIGDRDLTISRVRTTCVCAAGVIGKRTIHPGEESQIEIRLRTGRRFGREFHSIYIHSNDPEQPIIRLVIAGTVKRRIIIVPRRVFFGEVTRAVRPTKEVRIFDAESDSLEIAAVESTSKFVLVKSMPTEDGHKKGVKVSITLREDTPFGELKERVIIRTKKENVAKIEVPVMATVRSPIQLSPDSLFFVYKGDVETRKVAIWCNDNHALTITRIETDLPFISVKVSPIEQHKTFEISVTLKPDAQLDTLKGMITIHTATLDQPLIRIPVHILVLGHK